MENELNIKHACVLLEAYNSYTESNKPVTLSLEDGNVEHAKTISDLVDWGYIHVVPYRNILSISLSNEGVKFMKSVDYLKKNFKLKP